MTGYAHVPAWVFQRHSGDALRLYCALASFAGPDRTCHPKRQTIAERAAGPDETLGEGWVTRHLRPLIESGAVKATATGRGHQFTLPEQPPDGPRLTPERESRQSETHAPAPARVTRQRESRASESHAPAQLRVTPGRESESRSEAETPGGEGGAMPCSDPSSSLNSPSISPMNSPARATTGNQSLGISHTESCSPSAPPPVARAPLPADAVIGGCDTDLPETATGTVGDDPPAVRRTCELIAGIQAVGNEQQPPEPINAPKWGHQDAIARDLVEVTHWPGAQELLALLRWLRRHRLEGWRAFARDARGLARNWHSVWAQWIEARPKPETAPADAAPPPRRVNPEGQRRVRAMLDDVLAPKGLAPIDADSDILADLSARRERLDALRAAAMAHSQTDGAA